jgi:hypothetical protein
LRGLGMQKTTSAAPRPHSRIRPITISILTLLSLLSLIPGTAVAAVARVTWRPATGAAGYRLYLRAQGATYGAGTDLRLPAPDGDGLIRYLAQNVPAGMVSYFALTSYNADGSESVLSNEIPLIVPAAPTATATATMTLPSTQTRTATAPPATATRTPTIAPTRTPTLAPTRTPTTANSAVPSPTPTSTRAGHYHVSGRLRYYGNSSAVNGATVMMAGSGGTIPATTDTTGSFDFPDVTAGAWELNPEKQGDVKLGVTALDAAYVLQAVNGSRTLDATQQLACDVTGNGALSALDASRILQFAVGMMTHLPVADACASDFVFVPDPVSSTAEAVTPLFTNNVCQPGGIRFNPLQTDATEQNFTAALFGDCTGNWSSGTAAAIKQTVKPARVWLGRPRPWADGAWRIPVYVASTSPVDAVELQLDYDPLAAAFESVQLANAMNGGLSRAHADASGLLRVAVANPSSMQLRHGRIALLVLHADRRPTVQLLGATINDDEADVGA